MFRHTLPGFQIIAATPTPLPMPPPVLLRRISCCVCCCHATLPLLRYFASAAAIFAIRCRCHTPLTLCYADATAVALPPFRHAAPAALFATTSLYVMSIHLSLPPSLFSSLLPLRLFLLPAHHYAIILLLDAAATPICCRLLPPDEDDFAIDVAMLLTPCRRCHATMLLDFQLRRHFMLLR